MFEPLPRRSSGKKKRNKDLSPVFEKTDGLSLRITVISDKTLLRDGFRFEYTKKKVACQKKATTRYGRILLICSSARPKKERGRVGSEEKSSADDYQLKSCILCQSTGLLASRKNSTQHPDH
jgi:hypothetical protein